MGRVGSRHHGPLGVVAAALEREKTCAVCFFAFKLFWVFNDRFFDMDLTTRFNASFIGTPSPPRRETPLPRLPQKKAPGVTRLTMRTAHPRSHLRPITNKHLRDVTNNMDLGIVLDAKAISKLKMRITTTLTTVEVYDGRVVRGRLNKKGLFGAAVEHIDPFG